MESRLRIARQVADRFASHVEVVFFREAPNPAVVPVMGIAFNASPQRDLAQPAWDRETGQIARAKEAYDRWMAPDGAVSSMPVASAGTRTARWSVVAGSAVDLLPSRARACDLIVAGGPGEDTASSPLDDDIIETA